MKSIVIISSLLLIALNGFGQEKINVLAAEIIKTYGEPDEINIYGLKDVKIVYEWKYGVDTLFHIDDDTARYVFYNYTVQSLRNSISSGGTVTDSNINEKNNSLLVIDNIILDIDSNKSLSLKEFDATEVYGHSYDGGGVIQIYSDSNSIVKVYEQIGLSYGSVTTIIYFSKGIPIKIIDSEDNFALREDKKGLDYTKITSVFKAEIYIFDWEKDENKTIKIGKRNQSEGTCGIFEYEGLIDKAKDLLK